MPKNKKPRKKKNAFSGKQQRTGNVKKLAQFNEQIEQLYQQGDNQQALVLSQQALTHFPNDISLLINAGMLAQMLNDIDLAIKYCQKILRLSPSQANIYNNLANLFREKKQFEEAIVHYKSALKINSSHAEAHNNLADLLKEKQQFEEAIEHYKAALQINPKNANTHYILAFLLESKKQFIEAQAHYQTVLKLNPNHAETHNNLANLLKKQKQFEKALEHYRIALKINPNYATARWNLSLLQLTLDNFSQGWKNYEYRYHESIKNRIATPPAILTPQYQGEDIKGKNILVCWEQGLGDELQFIRYLPLLKAQKGVKKITLVCKPSLKKLFSSMNCIDLLLAKDEFEKSNIQDAHYWMFIMSLPLYFNTTLETIPNKLPYLYSSKAQQDTWQDKLPLGFENSFNIGLVWKGQAKHHNDENRSLPSIKILKPLWQVAANINFISLQKGSGEEEAQTPPSDQPLTHLGDDIQDFADTAAIVSQLDLVICVDTAIAHLAGSLNIPCWVLLPDYSTDWRWLLDRDDSPWYPHTMRLFRQSTDGDWGEVIDRVAEALIPFSKINQTI